MSFDSTIFYWGAYSSMNSTKEDEMDAIFIVENPQTPIPIDTAKFPFMRTIMEGLK
jgi:hypothetical protein